MKNPPATDQPSPKKPPKRRFGDRHDGRRLRSLDPIMQLVPFIMDKRAASINMLPFEAEITEVEKYVREKRVQGMPGFGILHFVLSAYIRVVSQRPGVNRFISGQRVFARNNITVCFTLKKQMRVDGQETVAKITFEPTDTPDEVYRKVTAEIDKARQEGDSNDTDVTSRIVTKLPRPLLRFTVALFKWMDYHRILPKSIDKASPFHCSMYVADIGSIFLPAINHHLYEFGNCPLFFTIGKKYKKVELDRERRPVEKKYVSFVMTIDERIVDGMYFSTMYRTFMELCARPHRLDTPPETVVEDVM